MAADPRELTDDASDDDVLLLMTLRTVVELMGNELASDEPRPALPDEVVSFIGSADPARLKHLIILAAVALADRIRDSNGGLRPPDARP